MGPENNQTQTRLARSPHLGRRQALDDRASQNIIERIMEGVPLGTSLNPPLPSIFWGLAQSGSDAKKSTLHGKIGRGIPDRIDAISGTQVKSLFPNRIPRQLNINAQAVMLCVFPASGERVNRGGTNYLPPPPLSYPASANQASISCRAISLHSFDQGGRYQQRRSRSYLKLRGIFPDIVHDAAYRKAVAPGRSGNCRTPHSLSAPVQYSTRHCRKKNIYGEINE